MSNEPSLEHGAFHDVVACLVNDRQGKEGLSPGDRQLGEIGCLVAVGAGSPELAAAFHRALDAGLAPSKLEAMLVHAIGYLGVVVAGRAHRQLDRALASTGLTLQAHAAPGVPADRATRASKGAALYDRFDPGRQAQQAQKFAALSPHYYPRAMELSGLVLADPILPLRERQVMTVAMLSSLGGQPDQLRFHLGAALRHGVGQDVIAGVLILVQAYAGMPRANTAAALALEVLAARG